MRGGWVLGWVGVGGEYEGGEGVGGVVLFVVNFLLGRFCVL